MTQADLIKAAYDRMDREAAAHLKGEEVEEDRILNDAREGVDPDLMHSYVAEPTGEDKRPAYEYSTYEPKAVGFNQIMELWAAHEGGRLLRVLHVPGKDSDLCGEDDAQRAWEWVARTPGWNPVIREVMRHLELRKKSWAEWPKTHQVLAETKTAGVLSGKGEANYTVEYCPWPMIPLEEASEQWRRFYRLLRIRYRRDPFTIRTQIVKYA